MAGRRLALSVAISAGVVLAAGVGPLAATAASNVRLTNDDPTLSGYVSDYTLVTGQPYSDDVLAACSQSRGRQNEPALAIDPRNTHVIVGSSNDYCGVFNSNGTFVDALGPEWMGYYRSEDRGVTFVSSLIPGYPGDSSPYAAHASVRTSGAGDPVLAWDRYGRLFAGSESSGDPDGSAKTLGDEWIATYQNPNGLSGATIDDGKQFVRSVTVASGTSAPSALGKFNDKTAIEVDRTGGTCDGNVYFAWSRFTGNTPSGYNASVYFIRSTDHGATFSTPLKLSQTVHDIQFPSIAVTGDGHVFVAYRQLADTRSNQASDTFAYNESTDCGRTFSAPHMLATFEPYDPSDLSAGSIVGQCGDGVLACQSGYTFMRGGTQVRITADQTDAIHDYVYVVYDPSIPGTEVASGTTYGSITSEDITSIKDRQEMGSQSGIYFLRLDGVTGTYTTPVLIDDPRSVGGLQRDPAIAVDQGTIHVLWWDSRNDPCYDPRRPLGDCADGSTVPSLDVYASSASTTGLNWSTASRVSDTTTNPNYEQFSSRQYPFGGDYLYNSAVGSFSYGAWTDWRNVVAGSDLREAGDSDADLADVKQCRIQNPDGSFTADTCPWEGGLDQNIYGAATP